MIDCHCCQAKDIYSTKTQKGHYTKLDRPTVNRRVTWAECERVNFHHRQIMIPPRKTKTSATYAPPRSATPKLRCGRQESLISVPHKRKSFFYSRPRNDLPAQQVSRHIVLTTHNHPVPKVKKQWSCTFRRRPRLVAG